MKAFILAAGVGERLKPLSTLRAKPVLPFLNKPLIVHQLEYLREEGIREVAINLHHLPETVQNQVSAVTDIEIILSFEPELLGTSGALKKLASFFQGENYFLLVNGDTWQEVPVKALREYHEKEQAFATLVIRNHSVPGEYTALEIDSLHNILALTPYQKSTPYFMYCGAQMLSTRVLEYIPENNFSDFFQDIFPKLLHHGEKIKAFFYNGPWAEIGTPQKYLFSSLEALPSGRSLIDNRAILSSTAKIKKSIIGPKVVIKEKVTVQNSIIWEEVTVGASAQIKNCIVTQGVSLPPHTEVRDQILIFIDNTLQGFPIDER